MELAKEAAEKQSTAALVKPSTVSSSDSETRPKLSLKSMFPLKSEKTSLASSGLQVKADVVTQQSRVEPLKPNIKIQEDSSVPCEKQIPLLKKVLLRKHEVPADASASSGAVSPPPKSIPQSQAVDHKTRTLNDQHDTQSESNISETSDCDNPPSSVGSTPTKNCDTHQDTLPVDYQLIPENIRRKNSNNSNQLSVSSNELGSSDSSSVTTVRSAHVVSSHTSLDSNIIVTPELLRAPTLEGYAARRTRLVRMQAFEFDSQDEDEALQSLSNLRLTSTTSTAVQTDDYQHDICTNIDLKDLAAKGVGYLPVVGPTGIAEGTSDALLEVYFGRVMKCMKQVLKTYLEEAQCDLQDRIQQLQHELEQKTAQIEGLQDALQGQNLGASATGPSSILEDVSSLSSALSSSSASAESDNEEDGPSFKMHESEQCTSVIGCSSALNPGPGGIPSDSNTNSSSTGSGGQPDEAAEPKLDSGHRFSWPSSLSLATRRNIMKPASGGWKNTPVDIHRPGLSAHQGEPPALNPDDLWLAEFPQSTEALMSPVESRLYHRQTRGGSLPSMGVAHPGFPNHPLPGWSARLQPPPLPRKSRSPDWELKMLVQQFDRKLKERRKRRHSSGEVLSFGSFRKKPTSAENVSTGQVPDDRPRQLSLSDETKSKRWSLKRATSSSRRFSLPQFMTRSSSDAKRTDAQQKVNEAQQKNEGLATATEDVESEPEEVTQPTVEPPVSSASKQRSNFFQNKQLSLNSSESQSSLVHRASALPHSTSFTGQAGSAESLPSASSPASFMVNLSNHIRNSTKEPQQPRLIRQDSDRPSSYRPDSFSSLHCLPTISEDDYSRPTPSLRELRFLHSQSFCEDYSTPFGNVVMGDHSLSDSAQQNTSRISLPETTVDRALEVSDCSEETPLITQTSAASVVISMPEYQPLLTPP